MNTAVELTAYGAALALLTAGAWATGSAVGPLTTVPAADAAGHGAPGAAPSGSGSAGHATTEPTPAHDADGHSH